MQTYIQFMAENFGWVVPLSLMIAVVAYLLCMWAAQKIYNKIAYGSFKKPEWA